MLNNRSSVSHTVNGPRFKYDVMKGQLAKRSSISKVTHPLAEVEAFKQNLLQRKLLKDEGTHWSLKKPLRTGCLMAFNLHAGRLVTKPFYNQDIIVSEAEASALDGKLEERQICVTDSEIVMNSVRDCLRFSSVNIMEVDRSIFAHHGEDSFGKEEEFVLKILQKQGVVSEAARHGEARKKEADIVDDATGQQFEITYEFKTELSKRRMKPDFIYNPEILVMQLVDNPFIHTSRSLLKKFEKEYTDQYRSNLVILTLGTKQAVVSMLEALIEKMKEGSIENLNFENTYIIALNFIDEKVIFCRISHNTPFFVEQFPYENEELGFIRITPVNFTSMVDGCKYLMICDNIFDGVQRCRYDDATELHKWAKEVRIWGLHPE